MDGGTTRAVDAAVETLFRTKNIVEVRAEEAKTRRQIEEKKQQLRHVVGDSYRDLISSADTIINISRSCHHMVDVIGNLQRGLADVASGIEQRRGTAQEQAASSYDRLYALGSRVKFVVDGPEAIYGCLDGGQYLAAARRFARCVDIHKALSAHPKQIGHRFPLLHHQWPLVRKFRGQIRERALEWLGQQGSVSTPDAAAALAAVALLQPMVGVELLKTYLSARQAFLTQSLERLAGDKDSTPAKLAATLSELACFTCHTVAQCGELFLPLPGISATPTLLEVVRAQGHAAGDELPLEPGSAEAAAWATHQQAAEGRLADLCAAGVALECSQWLDGVSHQLKQQGGGLLGACASGGDLLAVESAVRGALDKWAFLLAGGAQLEGAAAAGTGAGAESASGSGGGGVTMAWSDVCQWVLAAPCGLWHLLLEVPLLERAKQLVAVSFTGLVGEVSSLLDAALADAATLPLSAPGTYLATGWADLVVLEPGTPDQTGTGSAAGGKHRRVSRAGGKTAARGAGGGTASGGAEVEAAVQAPPSWVQQVEQLLRLFDQQLEGALSAALSACYGRQLQQPAPGPRGYRRSTSGGGGGAATQQAVPAVEDSSRAVVLVPFVQERCAEAAGKIASLLRGRVEALPAAPAPGAPRAEVVGCAPAAYQALVLGRVALGIADRSTQLPAVLGPPELWQSAGTGKPQGTSSSSSAPGDLLARRPSGLGGAAGGLLVRTGSSRSPQPPSPELVGLQQRFRDVGGRAYRLWADWAAGDLAGTLVGAWASDHVLAAGVPLRAWEETVIAGAPGLAEAGLEGGGDAGGGGDMRFELPVAPSPAATAAALAACLEADRAGGHEADEAALGLLKWHVAGAVVEAVGLAAAPGGALDQHLSEKGALQLLFDLRFLHTLLAGGPPSLVPCAAPAAAGAGPASTAAAARRGEVAEMERLLSGRLDPIDWATYESFLYANQRKFGARSQILFGLLNRLVEVSGNDAVPGAAALSGGESNVLGMASAGPRFPYLPVNAPASALQAVAAAGGLGGGVQGAGGAAGPKPAGALLGDAAAESFSFASLGGGRAGSRRAGGSAEDGSTAAAAAAGGSSASGVGAAAMEALGRAKAVGSLLGDKAATVMGEYTFGSMSAGLKPAGLLSSLNLSSFSGSGGGSAAAGRK